MTLPHRVRPSHSLNGLWDCSFLGAIDHNSFFVSSHPFSEKVIVPSAFDALPAHAGQRGAAIYRTRFTVPPGRPSRIEFGAVSLWTRIFVDGELLREHACGYAPFAVEVLASSRTERELVVLVDNRFDFDRVPMHEEPFDFYQYGGILRDVTLHILPTDSPFIDSVWVTPTADFRAGVVELTIALGGDLSRDIELSTQFDEGETT